jgi:hypothetical protein
MNTQPHESGLANHSISEAELILGYMGLMQCSAAQAQSVIIFSDVRWARSHPIHDIPNNTNPTHYDNT